MLSQREHVAHKLPLLKDHALHLIRRRVLKISASQQGQSFMSVMATHFGTAGFASFTLECALRNQALEIANHPAQATYATPTGSESHQCL